MSEQEIIIESKDSLELNIENFNKYMDLKLKSFEKFEKKDNTSILSKIKEIESIYTTSMVSNVYSANKAIEKLIPLYESILYQN